MSLFERIIQFLDRNQVEYQLLTHEPVWTSEQAARVRPDINLHQGAKAMILKSQNLNLKSQDENSNYEYFMVVVPGDQRVDYKKVAKFLGVKDCTLASPEEVEKVVGVKIGAVSPLGNLSGLRLLVDSGLLDNEKIAFNAGDHAKTVVMKTTDFLPLSQATVGEFAKEVS